MALALYRRYRPDTFDGIIGQNQVTVPLSRALDENKLTHAYLFSGPRGCGKTSSARIFARCINCAKGPTSHPCGKCDSCKDLSTGGPGSIDVVEIDAASHNGVDDARELRERAGFAPVRDRYKIFILDEAHMVTQQGFNALLKIVEEPPEHVMFIFATTEPEKVIGTIRSRTHHYPFRLVPQEVMGPYLEEICSKEDIKAEPGVLKLTMRAGGGSVRDTLSVLDQLMVGAADGTITYDSAVALLGFTPESLIGEAVDTLIDHDGTGLYGVIQKVVVGGFEPQRFVEDLLAHVRDLLVLKLAGDKAESVLSEDSDADQAADLHRQADALDLSTLISMADCMNKTLASMNGSTSPRMRLELLAARLLAIGCEPMETPQQVPAPAAAAARQAAPVRSGFIGSKQQGQSGQGARPSQAASHAGPGPFNPASAAAAAGTSTPSDPAEAAAPGVAPAQGGQPTAVHTPTSAADDKASVPTGAELDKRWDALVAALPEEVRDYVVRSKVPTVDMAAGPSGRQMLAMTFDKPLSQHAFAMAVTSRSVDGETKVPRIIMVRARQEFGEKTMIAPSGTAANGEPVESVNKMSPQRRAEVKKEVALARANLSTMGLGSAVKPHAASDMSHAAREAAGAQGEPGGEKSSAGDQAGTGDGSDEGHHPGSPSGQEAPTGGMPLTGQPVSSGAMVSADQQVSGGQGASAGSADQEASAPLPAAGFGSTDSYAQEDDDDPWARPMPAQPAEKPVDKDKDDPSEEHEAKKVALPDLSDDTDPWAVPEQTRPAAGPDASPIDSGQDDAAPAGDAPSGLPVRFGPGAGSGQAEAMPGAGAEGLGGQVEQVPQSGSQGGVEPQTSAGPQDSFESQSQTVPTGFQVGDQFASFVPPTRRVQPGQAVQSDSPVRQGGHVYPGEPGQPDPDTGGMPTPAVNPENDVYSMQDARLGADTTLNQDDLTRMFDVSKVEDFTADDPANPLNIQRRRQARQAGE